MHIERQDGRAGLNAGNTAHRDIKQRADSAAVNDAAVVQVVRAWIDAQVRDPLGGSQILDTAVAGEGNYGSEDCHSYFLFDPAKGRA